MLDIPTDHHADGGMAGSGNRQSGIRKASEPRRTPGMLPFAAAGLFVAAVALFGTASASWLPATGLPLLFLVAVLGSAATFGLWPGIAAAAFAFATYNFLFVEPLYTLRVGSAADVLALSLFLFTAALTGWLAGRARDEADAATRRAAHLGELSAFSAELGDCVSAHDVMAAFVHHAFRVSSTPVVVMQQSGQTIAAATAEPADTAVDDLSMQACERAFRYGSEQAATAPGWQGSRFGFHPIVIDAKVVAVAGIGTPELDRQRAAEIDQTVTTMVAQAASAIGRISQMQAMEAARVHADQETLRAGLLSSLSHDLRTPLATILGSVSTLRELGHAMPEAARMDLLAATEEETRRLARYVDDLLTMTRLKTGLKPQLTMIEPGDAAHSAVTRARAAYPGCRFELTMEVSLPKVSSDPALVEQALFNLLDNAAKFSDSKPVFLMGTQENGGVRFDISDQGPGIAPEVQTMIFDPLFRGRDSGKSGTGLGLAIVKSIAETLGGAISVRSPAKAGKGSAFSLFLPANGTVSP